MENLDVDKRITLIGDGADVVAVRAADAGDHVFEVIASWVNISGFAIKGATRNAGIYLNGADHCNIYENNCSNNTYGVILYSSSNYNTLTENDCSCNQCGIFLGYYSSHNTLIGNNCSDNYWYGIYMSSNHNTLYHNNLVNNTNHNAYNYNGSNQWDSGSEGNYYSDYNGTDNNTDGIGDDPHPILGGTSTDRFPLMQPWTGGTPQKGDLNHDGILTPADAAIALRIAATGAHNSAADVSGDDRVTSLDALMILQAAAGRIEL